MATAGATQRLARCLTAGIEEQDSGFQIAPSAPSEELRGGL